MTQIIQPKTTVNIESSNASGPSGDTNLVPPLPPELTIYAAGTSGINIYSAPELVLQNNPLSGGVDNYLGVAIDDNFEFLAAVGANTLDVWNLSNNQKLTVAGTQPNTPRCCTFNRAGDVVAVGSSGIPQLRLYSFPALADLSPPSVGAQCDDVRYNNDDSFFACAISTGETLRIFDNGSSPPTQITAPLSLIGAQCFGCDWSPDGDKVAQAAFNSPWMRAWISVGSPPYEPINDPVSLPETLALAIRFHPTQNIVAVGSQGGLGLSFYSFSGTSPFVRLANADVAPTGVVLSLNWSPDGNLLIVVTNTSPFLFLYDTSSLPYTFIGSPAVPPADAQEAVFRFNPRE